MGKKQRLNSYLKSVRDSKFKWGENDCLTFTNNAWRVMHGFGWADEWIGEYTSRSTILSRRKLIEKFGFSSIIDAIDQKLSPVVGVPPTGALVVTKTDQCRGVGYALGINLGSKSAFISELGVIFVSVSEIEKSWI